jgi:cytoskeletal protein RodZ
MDDLDRLEAKGLARAKSRSRRRRVSTIRKRTIRGALALFALVWGIVFVQMVSGNDPALKSAPTASAQAAKREPETEQESATETEEPVEPETEPLFESEPEAEAESEFEETPAESEFEEAPAEEAEPEPVEPVVTSAS